MKSLILALLLVSGSAIAQASQEAALGFEPSEHQVQYLSWCEDNKVMTLARDGQLSVLANCSETGLTCKTLESYRGFGVIVTATCQAAQ